MRNLNGVLMFFLVNLVLSCKMQKKENLSAANYVDTSVKLELDSSFIKNRDKSPIDLFIATFADSINGLKNEQLPLFLSDAEFDFHHVGIFSSFHEPLPLRKLIFDQVINCKSLSLIISNNSDIYKKKPNPKNDIQVKFQNLSVFDLAEMRFDVLKCSSN
ncbi:hypothetical protein [Pinibacter aurantiacus]|uniref:Lipoprotein n=1 Tax=Pinibacter aurantiacus TaxID=2851599 RepID=A0A9E2W917_9BACT|nr:hypothetical protein [Pinibacter aurantiacus]MBV4359027.1 hypothetical protein [Pinibacter aurantiacus]